MRRAVTATTERRLIQLGVAFDEPLCLGGPATALFDPAVAGVGLGAHRAIRGADRIGEEQRRVLMQTGLIAFEREDIIRAFIDDAPGDFLLRPHGVDRHDRALEGEHVQEFRDRRDLVGLSVDRLLGEHEPRLGGVGRNQSHAPSNPTWLITP